jgi:hypothetical protein
VNNVYLVRGLPNSGQGEWLKRNAHYNTADVRDYTDFVRIFESSRLSCSLIIKSAYLHELSPAYAYANIRSVPNITIVTCIREPKTPEELHFANTLRVQTIPDAWRATEIMHYPKEAGWYRPTAGQTAHAPSVVDLLRRELSLREPNIQRMRTIANA